MLDSLEDKSEQRADRANVMNNGRNYKCAFVDALK